MPGNSRIGEILTDKVILMHKQAKDSYEILCQSQALDFPYSVEVLNHQFCVHKGVFSPEFFQSTPIFSAVLMQQELGKLLEIGCGIGATSALCLLSGAASSVTAVDISEDAVLNTRKNLERKSVDHLATVLKSDVFSDLDEDEKFDSIYWNLPFINIDAADLPNEILAKSLFDPDYICTRRFFSDSRARLKPGGFLFAGFGDFGDVNLYADILDQFGWQKSTIATYCAQERNPVTFILDRIGPV